MWNNKTLTWVSAQLAAVRIADTHFSRLAILVLLTSCYVFTVVFKNFRFEPRWTVISASSFS